MGFIRNLLARIGLLFIVLVTFAYLKFGDTVKSFDPQAGSSWNWGSRPWRPGAWRRRAYGKFQ